MGVESLQLWEKIFIHNRKEYRNLCKLANMVIDLSSSNSSVEQAFGLLTVLSYQTGAYVRTMIHHRT